MTDEQPGADATQAPDAPGPGDPCPLRMRAGEARWIAATSDGLTQAYECVRCGGWHTRNRPPEWPPTRER